MFWALPGSIFWIKMAFVGSLDTTLGCILRDQSHFDNLPRVLQLGDRGSCHKLTFSRLVRTASLKKRICVERPKPDQSPVSYFYLITLQTLTASSRSSASVEAQQKSTCLAIVRAWVRILDRSKKKYFQPKRVQRWNSSILIGWLKSRDHPQLIRSLEFKCSITLCWKYFYWIGSLWSLSFLSSYFPSFPESGP